MEGQQDPRTWNIEEIWNFISAEDRVPSNVTRGIRDGIDIKIHIEDIINNRWTEKMFYDSCLEYLSNPEKRQRCYSGYNSFFLDPYGTIYKCVPDNKEFGNIRNNTFKSIWEGVQAQQVRDSTCPNCVLGCEFGNTAQYSPSLLKYKIGV